MFFKFSKKATVAMLLFVSLTLCPQAVFAIEETGSTFISPDELLDEELILETPQEMAINAKIKELGEVKAAINSYVNNNDVDVNLDQYYLRMMNTAFSLQEELTDLGADPDADKINEVMFSTPFMIDSILIDDFEDFERELGGWYDLWGVERTVNASYGTYEIYVITIQEYPGEGTLSTHIEQNGVDGWELHHSSGGIGDYICNEINNAVFDSAIGVIANGLSLSSWEKVVASSIKYLLFEASNIPTTNTITSMGSTRSHRIYCDTTTTVDFVFVKDTDGTWYHCSTANYISVYEDHHWNYSNVAYGEGTRNFTGNKAFSKTIFPDNYTYRTTQAITTFRTNKNLCYVNNIESYAVAVRPDRSSTVSRIAFTLYTACPENKADLFEYALS